jgi:ankyrin repeat protein
MRLLRAVEGGDLNLVKSISGSGADINCNVNGVTPLIVSVTENHGDIARYLIADDVNVNATGRFKMSALHHTCHLNQVQMAKLLLDQGADPCCATAYGITPLHICCREGNKNMIRLLLLFGADQFQMDSKGNMPDAYAKGDDVKTYIQEFSGRYMVQLLKQNKELQSKLTTQHKELRVLRQQLSMMTEVVDLQRKGQKKEDNSDSVLKIADQ